MNENKNRIILYFFVVVVAAFLSGPMNFFSSSENQMHGVKETNLK